jgi:hypothetical protein
MTPCWHCTHYDGLTGQGTAALCARPDAARVRSQPHQGCASWVRLVGVDDEPGPPADYSGSTSGVAWRELLPPDRGA